MNTLTNLAERVRFGRFELNVRTGELVSIGTAAVEAESATVQLRQQPFQILRILVERQGNIVTRQEIRGILWPNETTVEFVRSINVAMAILRKALRRCGPSQVHRNRGGARIPADLTSEMATEFYSRSGLTRSTSRYGTQDRRPNK